MSGPVIEEVVRNRADGSREYVDPMDSSRRYPSVTTVISAATSKPWLTGWAAKLAAEFAVDQLSTVATVLETSGREAAVNLIKDASRRQRDERRDIGSFLHDIVEVLVKGGPLPLVPDDLTAYVDAFIEWWVAFNPTPIATELTVCSLAHVYAGTADLIVTFEGPVARYLGRLLAELTGDASLAGRETLTILIDVKTGANIDPTMSAQLSAYRRADQVWLPLGDKAPMPVCDGAFVLHLRPEGYRFRPVDTDGRSFAAFLRMLEIWHWQDEKAERLVGLPILPPREDGTAPDRPLDHILESSPALVASLLAAGYQTCESLEQATPAQLQKIKGIGAKTVEKIQTALGEVGLKLSAGGA